MKQVLKKITLLLCAVFLTTNCFAYIEICFESGDCFITDGSCDGWCPNPPSAPTCSQGLIFSPNTDAITFVNGQPWIITATKKYQIASDKLTNFIKKTNLKYKDSNLKDKKILVSIQTEYKEFLKTDDGMVSPKRLAFIQRETQLKIVEKTNKKEIKRGK